MPSSTSADVVASATAPERRRRRRWMALTVALVTFGLLVPFQAQPIAGDLASSSQSTVGAETDVLSDALRAGDVDGPGTIEQPAGARPDHAADDGEEPDPGADPADAGALGLPPFVGRVVDLFLHLPAEDAIAVGFHEASSASHGIEPIGRLVDNHNTTRIDPPPDRQDGVDYVILSSRGRIHPPTSAIDLVLRDGEPVLAPVSGVVADIRAYELYGRYDDHRIEIHPDGAPHLRVVLVHVDELHVSEGERVQAGRSVLAGTANRFSFSSQIDRETHPERWPHVHLEVQDIDAPRPGDEPDEEPVLDD